MTDILSHVMGGVAIVLGFVSFQMHKRKALLIVQIATTLAFCAHYGLLGAWTGLGLNMLGAVRNLAYYHKDKKWLSGWKTPIFFAAVMLVIGIVTWEGYYSIFYVLSMMISSVCMSFSSAQNIRKSILVTSTLVLIYDVFVGSVWGIVYESVAIISAIIGIIVYIKKGLGKNEAQ